MDLAFEGFFPGELHDGSGCLDPLSLNPNHRAAQSRPATKLISPFRPLSDPSAAFALRVGLYVPPPHILDRQKP